MTRPKTPSEITMRVKLDIKQIRAALMEYCHSQELLPTDANWIGRSCKLVDDGALITFGINKDYLPEEHEHPTVLNNDIPDEPVILLCNTCGGKGFIYTSDTTTVNCPSCKEFRV